MGAKTAMCVALQWPEKVANLIPVDNAPVDAALKSDFGSFVKGMREVEKAKVKKQSEADEILKPYAEVHTPKFYAFGALSLSLCLCAVAKDRGVGLTRSTYRSCQSASSSSRT